MAHTRLIHDTARDMANATVCVFASTLREEEQLEAFRELYDLFKVHLNNFVLVQSRERARLTGGHPAATVSDGTDTEVKAASRESC